MLPYSLLGDNSFLAKDSIDHADRSKLMSAQVRHLPNKHFV